MQDSLDDNIDRLTSMMRKLTAQDDNQNKQFLSLRYIKAYGENNQDISMIKNNYDQRNCQNRYWSNSRDRRTSNRGRGQIWTKLYRKTASS